MANMISPLPNDPTLEKFISDPVTAATIAGSMYNGGMQDLAGKLQENAVERQNLRQMASNIAQQEQAQEALAQSVPFMNHDKAMQAAQAATWTPIVANALQQQIAATSQPQQPQPQEYQRGLLYPVEQENQMMAEGYTPLDQLPRELLSQIVRAKGLYQQAEQAGNAEAMAQAHNAANYAREQLYNMGVNPEEYGANGDLETAQKMLAYNDQAAMQDILSGTYSYASGDYYDRVYDYLRSQGVRDKYAAAEAEKQASAYQESRMKALDNAFNMYGHNGTTINPTGVQLLRMMADEDAGIAEYYTKSFAGPINEYGKQSQKEMATMQQAFNEKNMHTKHGFDLENKAVDQRNRKELVAINAAIAEARADRNAAREFEYAKAKIALQSYLNRKNGNGKNSGNTGLKTSEAVSIVKLYQEWNKEHEGEEAANPFKDAYDEATAVLNNQQAAPANVNDSRSVYSWAQSILEENYRRGYPATPDALYQVISSVGGYGKEVADDLKEKGMLEKYGRTS